MRPPGYRRRCRWDRDRPRRRARRCRPWGRGGGWRRDELYLPIARSRALEGEIRVGEELWQRRIEAIVVQKRCGIHAHGMHRPRGAHRRETRRREQCERFLRVTKRVRAAATR